jgi:flagellar hook protein FlgE
MIRSMFTAINALFIHQQYMDVVSDNLANVNTIGFKANYMSFQDQFAQTLRTGSAPSGALGGVNPIQIGLGAVTGTISPSFTQGALQSTGRTLDLAVQGDGFFVYNSGTQGNVYSRDGSLEMDSQGYLVNSSSGMRVQGWMADYNGLVTPGDTTTGIQIPIDNSVARQTSSYTITGNLNASANNVEALPPADPLGTWTVTTGVYDSKGNMVPVTLKYVRSPNSDGTPNLWRVYLVNDATQPLGNPDGTTAGQITAGIDTVYNATTNPNPMLQVYNALDVTATPTNGIVFDANGQPFPSSQVLKFRVDGSAGSAGNDAGTYTVGTAIPEPNPAAPLAGSATSEGFPISVNLGGMTMVQADSSAATQSQDGLKGGGLTGFSISDTDGKVYGSYSNGSQRVIGQLALATFSNPAGLVRTGDNNYSIGLNSGLARIGTAGSGDKGTIASGYNEGSNTDMSREFSNMILAQRGFQASTRIITTADQMLQELVNLKQ